MTPARPSPGRPISTTDTPGGSGSVDLAVLALLVYVSLRRRNECSPADVRHVRRRLLYVGAIAVGTYGALYGLTTWLGSLT
jgi:hypothetical protein